MSVPTQLPHHQLSEPAFRKLVEDVLGQTGRQLRSFQENFEKVLPPPAIQVSDPPSPDRGVRFNPLFLLPFLFSVFPITMETFPLPFSPFSLRAGGWDLRPPPPPAHALYGQ